MRSRTFVSIVLMTVAALAGRSVLEAQDTTGTRERTLRIVDSATRQPIGGVEVADKLRGTSAVTPATGTIALNFATSNGLLVEIRKAGYQPMRVLVDVADWTPITVALRPEASSAADAISAADFHERCSQRRLACVTEEQLIRRKSNHLSDLLEQTGAVKRHCEASVFDCVLSMKPSSGIGECSPSYFVDGVAFRWPPESALTELERLLRPADVLGIEIYRSEQRTPPALSLPTGCGVIAIWRR